MTPLEIAFCKSSAKYSSLLLLFHPHCPKNHCHIIELSKEAKIEIQPKNKCLVACKIYLSTFVNCDTNLTVRNKQKQENQSRQNCASQTINMLCETEKTNEKTVDNFK